MRTPTLLCFLAFCFNFSFSQDYISPQEFDKLIRGLPLDSLESFSTRYILTSAAMIDNNNGNLNEDIETRLRLSLELLNEYERREKPNEFSSQWKGFAYFYLENYKTAVFEFSKSIKLNPTNFKNFELRGASKKELKDYYGAYDDFHQAIKLSLKSYDRLHYLYNERGYCLVQIAWLEGNNRNRLINALSDYNEAIFLSKENGYYYYQKGIILGALGKIEEACKSLSKAGELGYFEAYDTIEANCAKR